MLTTLKEIVLLDDDDISNELHKKILDRTELFEKIHIFQLPKDLIEFVKTRIENDENLPEIYLIDILMPMLDGFEVIDELNELIDESDFSDPPKFVVLSGSNHSRDIEKFERMENTVEFLHKPLTLDSIMGFLGRAVV
jgi:CheY-like chemotaxis protein